LKHDDYKVARSFAEAVRARLPGRTGNIFLYGSRARGDEAKDSDYDVCIIAQHADAELEDQVMELAAQFLDRYDAFISPLIYTSNNFERFRAAGLFREILREGIRL
jgi:predicted nucleotidyltransferase